MCKFQPLQDMSQRNVKVLADAFAIYRATNPPAPIPAILDMYGVDYFDYTKRGMIHWPKYITNHNTFHIHQSPDSFTAAWGVMCKTTLGAPSLPDNLNLEINGSTVRKRVQMLWDAMHSYLSNATAIHLDGDVVYSHAAPVWGEDGQAVPANFTLEPVRNSFAITFLESTGRIRNKADWVEFYNETVKTLYNKVVNKDGTLLKCGDDLRMLVGLGGPHQVGVTNAESPTSADPDKSGANRFPFPSEKICMVHGHQPSAIGLYIHEDDNNERMSLDTQYTPNSIAFCMLSAGKSVIEPKLAPTFPDDVKVHTNMKEAVDSWGQPNVVCIPGPIVANNVAMCLMRSGPLQQAVAFVNTLQSTVKSTRCVFGQVMLSVAPNGEYFTGRSDILPGVNKDIDFEMNGKLFEQKVEWINNKSYLKVTYITCQAATMVKTDYTRPMKWVTPLDIRPTESTLAGSDFEGDLHTAMLFKRLAQSAGVEKMVFCGDATDHGTGNLAVLKLLNEKNIVKIIGNRDMNKVRLLSELLQYPLRF